MKEITVFVVGTCGSGKTTVARLIEVALKELTDQVEVVDDDPAPSDVVMGMRLANFGDERKIRIETVQLRRGLSPRDSIRAYGVDKCNK